MALLRLQRPMWASLASTSRLPLSYAWSRVQIAAAVAEGRRNASVKAQGAYKYKPKRTIPKKYGAKRSGDQFVVPGNIIFTQRGTFWWPGENCYMGRNFTIHAGAEGYVKYYRDPHKHPDRQYIGVTFKREDRLPYPPHAARKRRLNMECVPSEPRKQGPRPGELGPSGIPQKVVQRLDVNPNSKTRVLRLQDDYSYRESNYDLGKSLRNLRSARRKHGMRSRRLHFRMRRIKQERRHMRLRTQAREDRTKRLRGDYLYIERTLKNKGRTRERMQKKTVKKVILEGKTREEAEALAERMYGPRVRPEQNLEYRARLLALWEDPWKGKNPGAKVKAIDKRQPTFRGVRLAAPKYKEAILQRREKRKLRKYKKFERWQNKLREWGVKKDGPGEAKKADGVVARTGEKAVEAKKSAEAMKTSGRPAEAKKPVEAKKPAEKPAKK